MSKDILRRFEDAWLGGSSPALRDFVPLISPRAAEATDPARRELLHDLIKVDLEYRWMRARTGDDGTRPSGTSPAANGPRLEEYLASYPELAQQLPVDLIRWEYLVRRRCGDQPTHAEYAQRFPQGGPQVLAALRRLDAEWAAEYELDGYAGTQAGKPGRGLAARHFEAPQPAVNLPLAGEPATAVLLSGPALVEALRQLRFLRPEQLEELTRDLVRRFSEPRTLMRELLARDWLTPYQANQVLQGRAAELVLGSYLVLERLGEGGMGQVFKARHRQMGRVVALKVLRRELLADPDALNRFYREIRLVSQLKHPNIVHALDAGPIGSAHVLVMEYVEGTDLSRLVKQSGRVPVGQALDYVRQAASGLQHVHEKGLVHRDIKPSNLILSGSRGAPAVGLVKLLDLGLARLHRQVEPTAAAVDGRSTSTLTPVSGVMMLGTPDYLAPEQALNFHGTDIRADIYGLGCTLHFLLTGTPPFPGGTLAEKLWRHQQADPPDVRTVRAEVPPGLPPILRKMMAKRPADRFQTPAEMVAALAGLSDLSLPAATPDAPTAVPISAAPPARIGKSRRWFLAAGAALAGTVGVLAVALPGRKDPAPSPLPPPKPLSPLDRLDPANILEDERFVFQPKELVAVLGKHKLRHWGRVHALAFSSVPDGKYLLTGGNDPLIRIWDSAKGDLLANPRGHAGGTLSLAVAPGGQTWASGGQDGEVFVWDGLREPRVQASFSAHQGPVQTLAFTGDGKVLVTGGADGAVRLWSQSQKWTAPGETVLKHPHAVNALAVTSNGDQLLASASRDGVQIWDIKTRNLRKGKFDPVRGLITALAFSADGKHLLWGNDEEEAGIWDVAKSTMDPIAKFQPDGTGRKRFPMSFVGFGPGRNVTWVCNAVWLWDRIEPKPRSIGYVPYWLRRASAAQEGKVLALWEWHEYTTHDETSEIYVLTDFTEHPVLQQMQQGDMVTKVAALGGETLAISGGSRGVLHRQGFVKIHNWATGKDLVLPDKLKAPVTALAYAPKGETFATGDEAGEIRLWNARTGGELSKEVAKMGRVRALAYGPDNSHTLAAALAGTSKDERPDGVKLWNISRHKLEPGTPLEKNSGNNFSSLAFSPDGKSLFAGGYVGPWRILGWDVTSGKLEVSLPLPANVDITALAFSPLDGKVLAVGTMAGTLLMVDVARKSQRPIETKSSIWSLAYSADGKTLYSGEDGRLVRRAADGKELREWTLPGKVNHLAFIHGGELKHDYLAMANANGTVYILRLP